MKKLILSILFIFCLSFQASAWNPMVVVSGAELTCQSYYAPTFDDTNKLNVGWFSHDDYSGAMIDPDGDWQVCAVDFYITYLTGDIAQNPDCNDVDDPYDICTGSLTGAGWYVQIYELDNSTPKKLQTLACTSSILLGEDIDSAGVDHWFSETDAGMAIFTDCTLDNTKNYGFVVFRTLDDDITDDPEYKSYYFSIAIDDGNGAGGDDAMTIGASQWLWDSAIPYEADTTPAQTDYDVLIKIHTMQ